MAEDIERWQKLGEKLRVAREYLDLSQEEAANAVGMPRSALSLIENGRRKVDAVELESFAKLYRQSIESFTGSAKQAPLPENVNALARAATNLSEEDREELLRFAKFLQKKPLKDKGRG